MSLASLCIRFKKAAKTKLTGFVERMTQGDGPDHPPCPVSYNDFLTWTGLAPCRERFEKDIVYSWPETRGTDGEGDYNLSAWMMVKTELGRRHFTLRYTKDYDGLGNIDGADITIEAVMAAPTARHNLAAESGGKLIPFRNPRQTEPVIHIKSICERFGPFNCEHVYHDMDEGMARHSLLSFGEIVNELSLYSEGPARHLELV